MKYLLDTHVFVWSVISPEKLSKESTHILTNSKEVYVSLVSFWEISIKYSLGKIDLKGTSPEELLKRSEEMKINILPLQGYEVASFYRLTSIHRDPFDRMIVWQSIKNNLTLVSKDERLKEYTKHGLQLIW